MRAGFKREIAPFCQPSGRMRMQPTGQVSAHCPQPVHSASSATASLFSTVIAFCGQTRAHFPQPIQPAVQTLR